MTSIISNIINNTLLNTMRRRFLGFKISLIIAFLFPIAAYPLSPEFYSSSSKMASGRWVRIEVKETGMQFISNSTLKSLGFSDPSKVNVFGYGGRLLPELLNTDMTDDLPVACSVQAPDGIRFFGFNNVRWSKSVASPSHTMNPYTDHSYYFLSDIDIPRPEIPGSETANVPSTSEITTYSRRLLHEQDLMAPSNSGRPSFPAFFESAASGEGSP
ncbi:MAG: hypothetical protein K2M10_04345, partial [Muribaculaceae bacterium]|nr:hypothetical protein [Muribaculaceae bacterium]